MCEYPMTAQSTVCLQSAKELTERAFDLLKVTITGVRSQNGVQKCEQ